MHKIMAYDEKTGMIKEIYSEPYKDSAVEDLVIPNYLYLPFIYSHIKSVAIRFFSSSDISKIKFVSYA